MTEGPPTPRTLTLSDGRTVCYAQYGDPDGLPVLALHGAPACRLMYAWADDRARVHALRIIAPDRPGYGGTPADHGARLADRAAWFADIVDALGLDRFAILAISGGAPYAVALAALMQHRINALAIVSPMGPVADYAAASEARVRPVSFAHRQFFLRLARRERLLSGLCDPLAWAFRSAPDFAAGLLFRLAGRPDAATLNRPEVRRFLIAMTLEAFRHGGRGGASDLRIFSQPWQVDYGQIRAPTVLWQGNADRIVPPAVSHFLASQIPGCMFVPIEGAGHFWVLDHVDDVLGRLRGSIDRAGSAG